MALAKAKHLAGSGQVQQPANNHERLFSCNLNLNKSNNNSKSKSKSNNKNNSSGNNNGGNNNHHHHQWPSKQHRDERPEPSRRVEPSGTARPRLLERKRTIRASGQEPPAGSSSGEPSELERRQIDTGAAVIGFVGNKRGNSFHSSSGIGNNVINGNDNTNYNYNYNYNSNTNKHIKTNLLHDVDSSLPVCIPLDWESKQNGERQPREGKRTPMSIPMLVCVTLMIIMLASSTPVAESVDCFKCSSRNGSNPACEDPFHNLNTTRITSPVLPDPPPNVIYHTPCYAGKKGREGLFPASACIKLTGTFDATGETLVVRHCALDSGTLTQDTELARMSHCGKFQFEGDLLKGCVLACPEDACNSAPQITNLSRRTTIAIFMAALLLVNLIKSAPPPSLTKSRSS